MVDPEITVDYRHDERKRAGEIRSQAQMARARRAALSLRNSLLQVYREPGFRVTWSLVWLLFGTWAVLIFAAIGFWRTVCDLAWWIGGGK